TVSPIREMEFPPRQLKEMFVRAPTSTLGLQCWCVPTCAACGSLLDEVAQLAVTDEGALSKQCDLPVRKVERWFRRRRNTDRPSLSKKFCEACWRFTFYVIAFFTGLAVLYDVSMQTVPPAVLQGVPAGMPLLPSLFWYYMLELSFYWSLVFTLPCDVKRKDFKEQIVHHAATIFLISFSYCANYIRIGTLVLVIHDASDCFLEPTKIFNYMKWKKTCDSLFMIFAAVFLISRLIIFPYTVLYNTYYYSMEIFQPFFGYYFVNALLITLQLLHIFWSCLIIHMVYKFILQGTDPLRLLGREMLQSFNYPHGPFVGLSSVCPSLLCLVAQHWMQYSKHGLTCAD
uniref:TLC domain-containing protein n=1 Tax=Cairina moschata TaxID=8855 RepID=A0A8C3BLT0_CAIMO